MSMIDNTQNTKRHQPRYTNLAPNCICCMEVRTAFIICDECCSNDDRKLR